MDTYIISGRIKNVILPKDVAIVSANKTSEPLSEKSENKTPSSIFELINVDTSKGLTARQIQQSRKQFGENKIEKGRKFTFAGQFIKNLGDPIIRILIAAMIINILFMFQHINWPETIGIACAVFVATLVSTISEYGSEKAFEKLNRDSDKTLYTVKRDSSTLSLRESEILCGDVIFLGAGEIVPADCTLIKGEITVSQAPLTGESKEIRKKTDSKGIKIFTVKDEVFDPADERKIFKGCLCLDGECVAVVGKVGSSTFMGKVAKDLQKKSKPSPLKERLLSLAKTVSILGYIAAGLIMAAYLLSIFAIDANFDPIEIKERLHDIKFVASSLINAVTLGVSVIVVAVPEGLPMMITVVLSSNMKKMLKSGVLVRKPVGIETAGGMNILFTDKTGTLTMGNMKVTEVITREKIFKNCGEISKEKAFFRHIQPLKSGLVAHGKKTSTEKAMVAFCSSKPMDNEKGTPIKKLSFNSKNKYSACLYRHEKSKCVYILGAAEKLLEGCSHYESVSGKAFSMKSSDVMYFQEVLRKKTSECARVLALVIAKESDYENVCCGNLPKDMCALMLFSIKDDLRPQIRTSVETAKRAGVQVVMITGDNKDTAVAIAKEAGIIDKTQNTVLTGADLDRLSDEELIKIMPTLAIVSRALPSHKLRLVELTDKMGLVCGMTGDGINDAPSLKAADVGFAMGSGSDVAKEASDIILTNNSFNSITRAILYGRTIFESIRKFITFQLTMNLCAMGVSLICPFIGIEQPITVIQMLWVNIIMDTLGGLAFAGEIPLAEYMKRPPIDKKEKILTAKAASQILFLGSYTLTLSLVFLKVPFFKVLIEGSGEVYFLTCFFALFIFSGIFNSFNARSPSGSLFSNLAGNKAFITIIIFVCLGQIGIIYFGGQVFRTVPLSLHDLTVCALLSLSVIPADMIRKLFSHTTKSSYS